MTELVEEISKKLLGRTFTMEVEIAGRAIDRLHEMRLLDISSSGTVIQLRLIYNGQPMLKTFTPDELVFRGDTLVISHDYVLITLVP